MANYLICAGMQLKNYAQDAEITKKYPLDLPDVLDRSYEKDIIKQKYDLIEEIVQEVLVNKDKKTQATDKIDKFLTHPIWGVPIIFSNHGIYFLL